MTMRDSRHDSTHPNGAPRGQRQKSNGARGEPSKNVEAARLKAARPMTKNAVGASVPLTEWDRLSAHSRGEVEHLVEVLKSMKQGDFTARFEYDKDGILSRAGELLNDIIGLNEH